MGQSRSALWFVGRGVLALAGLGLAGLMLLAIALAVAHYHLPEIRGLADYRPKQPLRVFSADGILLAEYGEERRNFTPIEHIPKVMRDAVLSIEDARFYQHGGVDYAGIVRAGLANFAESRSQGASTITMQVARNFYLSTEKTFTRKIYEVLLALKIENQLSKDQILELYMNQIFLGQRAYGFAAASEIYFGKPLKEISIAEAAMLAGLPKAPSAYNPMVNPKRAKIRQQHIIDRMLENRFITPEQHTQAKAQILRYARQIDTPIHAEFAAETARQLVVQQYGEEAYGRGLNVFLTLQAGDQAVAYRALRKGIMEYERRQVYRGPEAYVDLPADPKEVDARVAEVLVEHPDNDELKAAVALEAGPKKVVAMLQSGETLTLTGDGLKPATSGLSEKGNPKTRIRRGAVIRLIPMAKGEWSITQLPEVEGAFVSMDPRSGAIKALVGGFDFAKNKFNHVTQAWRQPGSGFKPFVYSAALEKGMTAATLVNDAPLFFDATATGSQPWEPKNYDGSFDGPITIRRALAKSKNMVSIRLLRAIGPSYAQSWAARFGFDAEKHPAYLTLALGAGSVTPMQMASAYAVFANGGHRVNPLLISRITDTEGRVLSETRAPELDDSNRVIEERNAFVMTSLMQEVARSGTAARASSQLKRYDIAGKTGTTNDSMDTWFAGYTPALVGVVWVGYDNPRKLGDRETGGGLSLPIWIDYMAYALRSIPEAPMPPPPGVVQLNGEWFFEEFTLTPPAVANELSDTIPPPVTEEEKKGVLELFKGQ